MEFENMNGALELSMDELALVNGGSPWSFIKDAANWVADHIGDAEKAVSTVKKVVEVGKDVVNFFRKIF